jgi:hypothetical protein
VLKTATAYSHDARSRQRRAGKVSSKAVSHHPDLVRIVDKIGNSLSAIEKEVDVENLTAVQPRNAKIGLGTFK